MDDHLNAPAHADLVDALLELATSTSQILDELTRAPDVPDRKAAIEDLRDTMYQLLAPISLLLGRRDLKAATAVIEAAANITAHSFDYAPCEIVHEPRRDPREVHRRLRTRSRPRRGART